MKNREQDESFIHHMLDETYRFTPEHESAKNSLDLFTYFKSCEMLSEDFCLFLKNEKLEYIEINYNEENSCFRFWYNNTLFDLPVNWSNFHQLFVSWQLSRNDLVTFESANDETCFAEVFNLLTPYKCDFHFCVFEQKILCILLPDNKKASRVEIEKKLGLTYEGPIRKAA